MSRSEKTFDHDVALSFAGENRAYVEEVAALLKSDGVRVFYDKYEQATLWGKDLYTRLGDVYQNRAKYCVIFISRFYRGKLWTTHELESAQARAFQESEEYILPARFDDTEIPGIRPTVGYIDLRQTTKQQLVDRILEKLGRTPYPTPHTVEQKNFNPYDEALNFISWLVNELKCRCDNLAHEGVSAALFDREGKKCLRVVVGEVTVYSFNIWMGGHRGDHFLQFYGFCGNLRTWGQPINMSNASNAYAEIVRDTQASRSMLDFLDVGLLVPPPDGLSEPVSKRFTFDEFIEALWLEIHGEIEAVFQSNSL